MARRSTKGWNKKSKYLYRNRENTSIEARVVENPSYQEGRSSRKWVAQIVWRHGGGDYPLKSRKFKQKGEAKDYIMDYIDSNPEPQIKCPECGETENLTIGGKSSSRGKRKTWWGCAECGYEAPTRHTVQR